MFLTRDELRDLTGYKQKSAIARFLTENRYPWEPDKDGWPKVPRIAVEARFQVKTGGPKLRLA
jgi:hypothetical protein